MPAERNIFGRLAEHVAALEKRLDDMQVAVFQTPPQTMEEFNRRLGSWEELRNQIEDVKAVCKGGETKDPL